MEQINLNYIPGALCPVVHCSQGDVGRKFKINLFDGDGTFTLDGTETLRMSGYKSDGNVFIYDLPSATGSYIEITLKDQMTACKGDTICEIMIEKGSTKVGTANFVLQCEPSPASSGPLSESALETIDALIALARETMSTAEASAAASAQSASESAQSASESLASANASANSATSSANSASQAQTYANNASISATQSANSASASAASEANAKVSEDNAKSSEDNALTYSNSASSSATQSANSASASASSASQSANSASSSATSASEALASKNAAKTSEDNAKASEEAVSEMENVISGYVDSASASAASAEASANQANTSQAVAQFYATKSAESSVQSANSATQSANSASQASASASSAETSATNALASKNAATESAADALSSKNAAASSESNAADYAADALASKNAAAASASAANSASATAQTSATNAQNSASQASASATAAATSASNAHTSEDNAEVSANNASTYADAAQEALDHLENMSVSANTLAAEQSATVTKSTDAQGNTHLTFGIPQGIQGEKGEKGDGSLVIANPTEDATDSLSKISIDGNIFSIAGGSGGSSSATLYIDPENGSDTNDGTDPDAPLATMQAALEKSYDNLTIYVKNCESEVVESVYGPELYNKNITILTMSDWQGLNYTFSPYSLTMYNTNFYSAVKVYIKQIFIFGSKLILDGYNSQIGLLQSMDNTMSSIENSEVYVEGAAFFESGYITASRVTANDIGLPASEYGSNNVIGSVISADYVKVYVIPWKPSAKAQTRGSIIMCNSIQNEAALVLSGGSQLFKG